MAFAVVLLAFSAIVTAFAADEPEIDCSLLAGKKIRWVLPYSLAGGNGVYLLMSAPLLSERLQAEVKVEHISGSGGLLGLRAIAGSKPDGLTIGIMNAAGTMVSSLAGGENIPNPLEDFTILARVARSRRVLVVAADSPIKSLDDVIKLSAKRPVILPASDITSSTMSAGAISAHLLGLDVDFVLGYKGTRKGVLALLRGEVDMGSYTFQPMMPELESGELRPLVQLTSKPISNQAYFKDVPLLGGKNGIAAQRARALGRDVEQAREDAVTFERLVGAGKLIIAPAGLDPAVEACLGEHIYEMFMSDEFRAAAEKAGTPWILDPARGADARKVLLAAHERVDRFLPVVKANIDRVNK